MTTNYADARELCKEIRHLIKVAWAMVAAGSVEQSRLLDIAIEKCDKLGVRLRAWRGLND